jgi:bacteriocin-like protein
MKNLLKKTVKKEIKSNVQKLDKNQLNQIVGGAEEKITFKAKEGATNSIVDDLNGLIR